MLNEGEQRQTSSLSPRALRMGWDGIAVRWQNSELILHEFGVFSYIFGGSVDIQICKIIKIKIIIIIKFSIVFSMAKQESETHVAKG